MTSKCSCLFLSLSLLSTRAHDVSVCLSVSAVVSEDEGLGISKSTIWGERRSHDPDAAHTPLLGSVYSKKDSETEEAKTGAQKNGKNGVYQ